jgi:uncharacterized protein YijF (DUF1287 family)/L,D-peptidoglycan transpeptidase YkuD (ErfK/YbiS/YcfS/YnhG family)
VQLLYAGDVAVGFARADAPPALEVEGLGTTDADGDGIPDALDIVLGAKKAVLNGARYTSGYVTLDYPGGDVPRDQGVCTDVVVRALRNAGFDLQKLVYTDMLARPGAYGRPKRVDRSIEHRRVRRLLPWFLAHWTSLPPERGEGEPYLPGDIVLMDTLSKAGPDHIGIVSDTLGASGQPLIVNNWTDGHRTAEMDLLPWVPITHRFRVPAAPLPLARGDRGLAGLLARSGLSVPEESTQVIVVAAPRWSATSGSLRRFERRGDGWVHVGGAVSVHLGVAGLGWGRGLHELGGSGMPTSKGLREGPEKTEGDGRSPAGVFALGTAFGYAARPPKGTRWPWRQAGASDRFVDDPDSPLYNTWQVEPASGPRPWRSAEAMRLADDQYRVGLVVHHNTGPAVAGKGSAIFLHVATEPPGPTAGCTVMDRAELERIVRWLEPGAAPVLVQAVGRID